MAAVLVAVAFVVQPLQSRGHIKAQQAARMALTAAVAEHGTVQVDRYVHVLGVDFAEKDGHLYSDKAPAQPLLAVPAYLAYRAAGGESAAIMRGRLNLGLWWISLWSAAVPAALLVMVMARLGRTWNERWSLPAALAMAFGSLLFPFGTLLFSHLLSALLVGAALLVWREAPSTRARLLATGALLGGAFASEYTAGVALAVIGLASLGRDRWKALWLALGAVGPVAAVGAYQWIAFGSPVSVPYQYHNLRLTNAGMTAPTLHRLWTLTTSGRGVFLLTPIVLVALVGLVVAATDRRDRRTELAVVGALFMAFLVVHAGATDAGGEALGPRYVIPGIPPLTIGLGALWARRPHLCAGVAALSAALMIIGTYTDPLPRLFETGLLRYWTGLLADGHVQDTLLEPMLGARAILLILAAAAGLTALSLRAHRRELAET